MSYIRHILQPGEDVRFAATIHWITYVKGFLVLILAAAMLVVGERANSGRQIWLIAAAFIAVIAGILIVRAWFHRWITEIAVTNRRVIYKTGFISRKTIEMQMDKVETVEVNQSVFGRVFGYGDVEVIGTGDTKFDTMRTIAHPIDLRNQITGT